MRILLPDVSVLIAMHDSSHPHHTIAQNWFQTEGRKGWATCPISENGFIRITAQTLLKDRTDAVSAAFFMLEKTKQAYHETYHFWSDSVSLSDIELFLPLKIVGHKQLTDVYLLGLCQRNNGTLVTFDTHMTTAAIKFPNTELLWVLTEK
jgi:uncharacterized protein